jgi:DNA-binding transcriptional LysR family regulator
VLTAPTLFGRLHVLPVVAEFLALFPEINIRLVLGDRVVNLVDDHIDMAVRIGKLADSGMIATRIGSMRSVLCGSPQLLASHGEPTVPDDLHAMPCVALQSVGTKPLWEFRNPATGAAIEVSVTPRLITAPDAAVDAAARGVGFVRLRHYQAFDPLRAGKLMLLLQDFEPEPAPVHLMHLPRSQMPLKMRRFLDFAAPRLRKSLTAISAAKGPSS